MSRPHGEHCHCDACQPVVNATKLRADPITGRARMPVGILSGRHSLRITERTDATTGVAVYDWTCDGCAFAFGFWCATEDEAKAAAAHHAPRESRHATEAERRAQPQISIVSSKKAV